MVDFSKHKHGDVVVVHCCDECARKAGVKPKRPADSGKASWLCDVCGHHGIGSLTDCEIGDWLRLRPLQPNPKVNRRPPARVGVRLNEELGGWWFGALDDRTEPFQAMRVDLGPEVRRQVHGAALQLFTVSLWRSPAWFLWFVHGAIVVQQKTVDTT